MGSMKELWLDKLEEERRDWICEQLGIGYFDEADEESEDWLKLEREYDQLEAEAEVARELLWLEKRSWTEELHNFDDEMSMLKQMLKSLALTGHGKTIYKMVYAHSVTLLESYLGDTLKTLIVKNPQFLENSINKVSKIKSLNYKLAQIYSAKSGVLGLVLEELSNHIYHRIPETREIYSAVLGVKLQTKIDEVVKITKVRHDIIHRNAKTISGDSITLDCEICYQAIFSIEKFVAELNMEINNVTNSPEDSA